MIRTILILVAVLIAVCVGFSLATSIIGLVFFLGRVVAGLLLLAALFYAVYMLAKPKGQSLLSGQKVAYKLHDTKRPFIYAFRNEPTLQDIAMLHDDLYVAKLELQGDVFAVTNDTIIKIVSDEGKEAVKVKINGNKKADATAWVARASVVKNERNELPPNRRLTG